jgi:hypothetical protein
MEVKEFMLIFRYTPTNQIPTQEQMQEMQKQWGEFIGNIAMQGKLVSTHQLGFDGNIILANKSVVNGFQICEEKIVGGNMILKADNIEVATELAKNCPILLMGGTVEVRSIIPMN